jgi:hypothetical protein
LGEEFRNIKELKVQRGSRVGELRRQNMIKLSIKKFFHCRNEVRIWGKKLKCQKARVSKGMKGRRIEKTKRDRALHQEVFLV